MAMCKVNSSSLFTTTRAEPAPWARPKQKKIARVILVTSQDMFNQFNDCQFGVTGVKHNLNK